jgi:hypothetical protein
MKLDIDLTPAQAERLREEAERLKITSEELAGLRWPTSLGTRPRL